MKVLLFVLIVAVFVVVISAESSDCLQPPVSGKCFGYFKRYAYRPGKGCEEFIYGGCGGNENNFNTYEDCEKKCLIPR